MVFGAWDRIVFLLKMIMMYSFLSDTHARTHTRTHIFSHTYVQ